MQCEKINCVANYNGKCCTNVCKGELVKVIRFDDNLEQEDVIAAKSKFYEMMTKKMNKIELKPCPFCGRTDTLIIHEVSQRLDDTDIKQYTVICNTSGDNAGCGANCGYRHFTKQDAIAAWNKRIEKTGKWIIKKDRFNSPYAVCSECGSANCTGTCNYCFECGAKMEEIENE